MLPDPGCKLDPRTRRWNAVCKANVTACKTSWQSHDDAGNLPWTTALIVMGQAYSSQSKWCAESLYSAAAAV